MGLEGSFHAGIAFWLTSVWGRRQGVSVALRSLSNLGQLWSKLAIPTGVPVPPFGMA